jgi:pimeloyl-ACP methyl ester carboxylesterase
LRQNSISHPHPKIIYAPVIITHGWPGSIIEQMKVIGPLTEPVANGGKTEDAFDVVIPSLPGHGFSGKPTELSRQNAAGSHRRRPKRLSAT